jgi:hypothetical protein
MYLPQAFEHPERANFFLLTPLRPEAWLVVILASLLGLFATSLLAIITAPIFHARRWDSGEV